MEPVPFLTQNSEPLSLVDILQSARDRLRAVAMHRARLQENQILMDPPFRKTLYSGHCRTPGTLAALKKPQRPMASYCHRLICVPGLRRVKGSPFRVFVQSLKGSLRNRRVFS